jgi:hypothetical protein
VKRERKRSRWLDDRSWIEVGLERTGCVARYGMKQSDMSIEAE